MEREFWQSIIHKDTNGIINIRLKEAKNNTDTLIDSDILIIEVEDDAIASFKNKINSSVDVFIIED